MLEEAMAATMASVPVSSFKFLAGGDGAIAGLLTSPDQIRPGPYKASYEAVRAIDKETTTPRRCAQGGR